MKKIGLYVLCLVVAMTVGLLSACAPASAQAQFVELPGEVKSGITAVVLVAVSWVFAKLISLVPYLKFLDPFRVPLAMAIAIELIRVVEVAVPDAFGPIAILALQLVLAVLALFGVAEKLKERGIRLFQ